MPSAFGERWRGARAVGMPPPSLRSPRTPLLPWQDDGGQRSPPGGGAERVAQRPGGHGADKARSADDVGSRRRHGVDRQRAPQPRPARRRRRRWRRRIASRWPGARRAGGPAGCGQGAAAAAPGVAADEARGEGAGGWHARAAPRAAGAQRRGDRQGGARPRVGGRGGRGRARPAAPVQVRGVAVRRPAPLPVPAVARPAPAGVGPTAGGQRGGAARRVRHAPGGGAGDQGVRALLEVHPPLSRAPPPPAPFSRSLARSVDLHRFHRRRARAGSW